MNLPVLFILPWLGLAVQELGFLWMELTEQCAPGTHQEDTASTNELSVPGVTLEVIQSKKHLKCLFFFSLDLRSSAPTVSHYTSFHVVHNTCQRRHSH